MGTYVFVFKQITAKIVNNNNNIPTGELLRRFGWDDESIPRGRDVINLLGNFILISNYRCAGAAIVS